ncbi:uncharacterized protein I303_103179 [Kwoniella dejecticola CBS 10117]|uniref:Aminoglycoside phosphotransferase domain-containing protein n=1 Tax=Kwoniella dejecticola CBS 10117 TaxID=1296121 RepID=A0A1A6AAT2_9TREE|nr:uncharacterized protein I303_03200 [Kwoniella dejecticola CBS 10117]OBR87176.1 hypothetical protein I303_03200 [Kwoniella dejecticola CBS 10117]
MPVPEIQRLSIQSEVSTLQTLRLIGIPVPQAWPAGPEEEKGDALTSNANEKMYLPGFFYEHLPGSCMPIRHTTIKDYHSVDEKTIRLIEEYGRFQIKMFDQPIRVNQIGSLLLSDQSRDKHIVGPMLSFWGLNYLDPPYLPGPFRANRDRYLAQIDIALSHISNGFMSSVHTLDAYLWHLLLRELVEACPELEQDQEEGFIRHADAKGDIFLVDDEGSLTAILYWENAYVTTKAEAFSSPLFLYNTYVSYEDRHEFTPREQILINYYERLERHDLAKCVRKGKKYQQLDTIGRFNPNFGRTCSP